MIRKIQIVAAGVFGRRGVRRTAATLDKSRSLAAFAKMNPRMPSRRSPRQEPAHDVLAAEAFAMPAADPGLHQEPAHDVLAAEAFAMPAADPALHHGPVVLPNDPSGIVEAHDVLAAEEFAMPAGSPIGADGAGTPRRPSARLVSVAAAITACIVLRRLRRR